MLFSLEIIFIFLLLVIFVFLHFEFQNWRIIAQYVHDILKEYPRLRLTHGRKVRHSGSIIVCFELEIKVFLCNFIVCSFFLTGFRDSSCY